MIRIRSGTKQVILHHEPLAAVSAQLVGNEKHAHGSKDISQISLKAMPCPPYSLNRQEKHTQCSLDTQEAKSEEKEKEEEEKEKKKEKEKEEEKEKEKEDGRTDDTDDPIQGKLAFENV